MQKTEESFKEYAQQWRELASRVQPPFLENKHVDMFICTLHGPYLEKLIGSTFAGFSDLMVTGERIESCLKNSKIHSVVGPSNGAKKPYSGFAKKNEGKPNNASITKGNGKVYQAPYQ